MPQYNYTCEECGNEFEIFMSLEDKTKVRPECPDCKSKKTVQLFKGIFIGNNSINHCTQNSGCCR